MRSGAGAARRHAFSCASWSVAAARQQMSRRPNATTPEGPEKLRRSVPIVRFPPVPSIRPFRALRYSRDQVDDLAAVVAPPYDVISPDLHRRLLARDPRNVVRLDLPIDEAGDPPDERYRRAGRTLQAWRSDGTLRRDIRAGLYPYEQTFGIPGTERTATRRGVFARVVLEPFGPDSGIRAHERTLAEPREDRYRLLRATGVNTSPVVGLGADSTGGVAEWLREVAATQPVAELVDDDEVGHRLWLAPFEDEDAETRVVRTVADLLGSAPITLADGHHRYETALRYCEERRQGPVLEDAPAWAEILMLILEPVEGALTVLPTHRVLLGLEPAAVASLVSRLPELFDVETGVSRERLVAAFGGGSDAAGGEGRFGLWAGGSGAILRARRPAFVPFLPAGGAAVRRLDVTLASVAIERLAGIDPAAVAEGRIAYTMSAAEAIRWVDEGGSPTGTHPASVALLLEPTPAAEIVAVAADGDVMPQKSTYIYPKALTGLVINPLE
jgi:uncharacterized protein (DUF1015 family)